MQPSSTLQSLIGMRRRLPLMTKQVNKGFYKGNRVGSMGRFAARGDRSKYIINYDKVRTYMVPDLTGFRLTPFVTRKIEKPRGSVNPDYKQFGSPISGRFFLEQWKRDNGRD